MYYQHSMQAPKLLKRQFCWTSHLFTCYFTLNDRAEEHCFSYVSIVNQTFNTPHSDYYIKKDLEKGNLFLAKAI